jgi:hypothetical protein
MIAIKAPEVQYVAHRTARLHDGPMLYGNRIDWRGQSTRHGPVMGVVGAIGSISAGLSAGGILGGVLIAGGVLGGIGALTGNKTLMAIGAVSSLAGGFISADTGAFFNPFGEGAGQSVLSKGLGDTFGSVFDKIKSGLGITPTNLDPAGSVVSNASQSVADAAGNAAKSIGGGAFDDVLSAAGQTAASTAGSAVAGQAAASGGSGLLGSIFSSPGTGAMLAGAASGAASGLLGMGIQNANVDLAEARTDGERQAQQIAAQRQQNMQFQNTGNMPTVNNNAQIYNQSPGNAQGRVPITMPDGSVQLVSLEQYAAMKTNGGQA